MTPTPLLTDRLQAWFNEHGSQLYRYPEEEYTLVQRLVSQQTGFPVDHLGLARHVYEALDTLLDVFLGEPSPACSNTIYCDLPDMQRVLQTMASRRGATVVNQDESGKEQPACTLAIMNGNNPYLAANVVIRLNPEGLPLKPYTIDVMTIKGAGASPYPPAVVIFPNAAWGEAYAKAIEPFHMPTHLLAELQAQLIETPLPGFQLPTDRHVDPLRAIQPRIQQIQPYVAGKGVKAMARALDKPEHFFVKLASNEHPTGLPAEVVGQIQAQLGRLSTTSYDDLYQQLQQALANELSLYADQVVIGTGSVDIIKAAVLALLGPNGKLLSPDMPFAMYPFEAQKRPASYQKLSLQKDYQVDVPAFCEAIQTFGPGLVVLENPRNPLGTGIADISPIVDALQPDQVLLLDEAYDDFIRQECPTWINGRQLLDKYPKKSILVQRTFSKSFGLAACRVGYAFGSSALVDKVRAALLPVPVDAVSLLAATVAFTHPTTPSWRQQTAQQNQQQKALLTNLLDKKGIAYVPSLTNFVFIHTGLADSRVLFQRLVETYGVIVRPAGPHALRVSIGNPADNQRLMDALSAVL
jgi:histidinol-phosphate aminotransferase